MRRGSKHTNIQTNNLRKQTKTRTARHGQAKQPSRPRPRSLTFQKDDTPLAMNKKKQKREVKTKQAHRQRATKTKNL